MLKDTNPHERLEEIDRHYSKTDAVSLGVAFACCNVLFALRHDDLLPFWKDMALMLFVTFALLISKLLLRFVWLPTTLWLGRFNIAQSFRALRSPDANPKFVESFLENWWRNEFVLDVFVVLFQVVVAAGMYRLVGPLIGLL